MLSTLVIVCHPEAVAIMKTFIHPTTIAVKLVSNRINCNSIGFSQMSRLTVAILTGCLVLNLSLIPAFAQSTDRDTATPLNTGSLSGRGVEQQDRVYYYKFTAKPGSMNITLDIDADDVNGNSVMAEISLQTPDGDEIASFSSFATQGEPGHIVKKINFASETPVILVLELPGGSTAGYNYRIHIDGAWS